MSMTTTVDYFMTSRGRIALRRKQSADSAPTGDDEVTYEVTVSVTHL